MFYQHLSYLKRVHCCLPPTPLVYCLYTCENVDNCERTPKESSPERLLELG